MPSIFKCNNLSYKNILKYPDINIESNSTTFIVGKSGCGKSTLLKLLNNSISPDTGTITYSDKDIRDIDPIDLRRDVILAGQSIYLFNDTIEKNFLKYYSYRNIPPIDIQTMKKYLSICCIDIPTGTSCNSMSGGERQRVYIAICLSFIPKVLMLDEPTSALDSNTASDLLTSITDYCCKNGITSIIVCHNTDLAKSCGNKIIEMKGTCIKCMI